MDEPQQERRRRAMTDEDVQAVVQAIDAARAVPHELHWQHHEYIGILIEREKRRAELVEKVKGHVLGWGLVTGIAGLGYAVWEWVKTHAAR